ncbi:hypothetical protein SAMN05444156_1038 [Verrucomicrobium sp. GAS474]|uniref:MOSC domain-containing protein n=1 Tax=Verrucomicrobium sp. GAS474 TaxID=1882831 RepID=UPI00087BC020|nr:MOSC domain-containing protein [Verrucomicrobium sp. GAS474]SDT95482.1 hypothetical protein SAMN05444156_1038 [Verrucomicrobium sp. GAS474]
MIVRRLYLSPGHNFFGHYGQAPGTHATVAVGQVECVAGRGIRGDRFFDFKENYKGQVTFLSEETFLALCRELGLSEATTDPGLMRRNIVVAGADLDALVGAEFEVQGVRFRGTAPCLPCSWMDHALKPGAEAYLTPGCRGGLRAAIVTDGTLTAALPAPAPIPTA